jgi:hypothetical protein
LFERIGLVCFGIAVLAEILAYPYSRRNDDLSAGTAVTAGREIERLKKEAESARATARAFESQIADANARVKEAEAQIASANARSREAKIRALQTKLELSELKAPRELKVDRSMIDRLRQFKGTPYVMYAALDAESQHLAESVTSVLQQAGWVRMKLNTQVLSVRAGISVNAGAGQASAWHTLFEMFHVSGIDDTMGIGPADHATNVPIEKQRPITITIGEKPKIPFFGHTKPAPR